MTKSKILYVNDFHHGGGAERVFEDSIQIIGSTNEFEVQYYTAEEKFKAGNLAKSLIFENHFKEICAHIDAYEPDIIHIHNFHNRIGSTIFSAIRHIRKKNKNSKKFKVLFTAHDFFYLWPNPSFCYFDSEKNFIKLQQLPSLSDFLFKKASAKSPIHSLVRKILWFYVVIWKDVMKEIDLVITPSDFLGLYFMKKSNHTPVLTVRNPCEVQLDLQAESDLKPIDGVLRIIFLGRLSEEKGLLQLIDLLGDNRQLPFVLDIFGNGHLMDQIQERIAKLNLSKKIFIKGEISPAEKNKLISAYDALVLPSVWYENAPLTIVEAAFAGLRILTCNYGGMKELATLCGGEYLFDPDDKKSFTAAINTCISDAFNSVPMKGRDVNKISQLFSMENYKNRLIEIYEAALEGQSVKN